jgi:hypothetical protein
MGDAAVAGAVGAAGAEPLEQAVNVRAAERASEKVLSRIMSPVVLTMLVGWREDARIVSGVARVSTAHHP